MSANLFFINDILKINATNLYDVRNAGKKTVQDVRLLQSKYSHLLLKPQILPNQDDNSEYIGIIPYSRIDLPFLSEDQYNWVVEHWQMYDIIPASFILYNYLIKSEIRNDYIHRLRWGFNDDNIEYSKSEISNIVDLTSERIRQILLKPVKFPRHLLLCRSILLTMLPNDLFCFNMNDLAYIIEREKLPLTIEKYCDFLCCIFNFISKINVIEGGNVYLVRRNIVEQYPIHIALKNIDLEFACHPYFAASSRLDAIVKITRNKEIYHELIPIFQEYIKHHYQVDVIIDETEPEHPNIIDDSSLKIDYDREKQDEISLENSTSKEPKLEEESSQKNFGKKILEIITDKGESWIEKYAYITFIKFLEYVGIDQVLTLNLMAKDDLPLLTKERIHKASCKPTKNGYYVVTNILNEDKAAIVNLISQHYNLGFKALSYTVTK